jgi:hypothetical protein
VRAKLGYCSDSNDAYSLRLPGSCCEKGEKTRKEKNEDKKKTDAGGRAELALCSHSNDEYSLRLEKEKKREKKTRAELGYCSDRSDVYSTRLLSFTGKKNGKI